MEEAFLSKKVKKHCVRIYSTPEGYKVCFGKKSSFLFIVLELHPLWNFFVVVGSFIGFDFVAKVNCTLKKC